jgi:hypothetical protein
VTDQPLSLLERARQLQAAANAKRAAEQEAVAPASPPTPQFDPALIPDTDSDSSHTRTDEDIELDRILDGIGILEAYAKWCGKMKPKVSSGRTESIMVSCPKPSHKDANPSAWLNTEKNTWFCGGCQEGGDGYDIAAYHHGFPVPGYKEGAMFHKLRRAMGEDLGYSFNEKVGGGYDLVPPVVVSTPVPPPPVLQPAPRPSAVQPVAPDSPGVQPVEDGATPPALHLVPPPTQLGFVPLATGIPPEPDEPLAEVISIDPEVDAYDPELDSDANIPSFPWREALKDYQDTFLYQWCDATSHDYSPEEYHLFSGLLLLGLAAGRDVLMGGDRPVMANLPICYLGKTGSGKSTAQNYIAKAIGYAMPENDIGVMVEGARYVGEVASGEALIGEFEGTLKGVAAPRPIKGYVEFSELSTILAKSSIQGSTLKTKIMDFIDGRHIITNSSQTHGRKAARDAFATFSTSSQPRALRKLLDSQDQASGYLNRWLYVSGPTKQRDDYFGGVAINLQQALNTLSGIAIASQRKNPTDAPVILEVTPEGRQAFKEFFAPVDLMIKRSDDDMIARLEIHYKKLMLCHAINRRATEVSELDVAFIEKLHPYILANLRLVGAQIGKSQQQEFIDRVLNYIKRKEAEFGNGLGPNRSMLYDAMKTKNIGTKQVNEAINELIKAGFIEEVKVQTGKAGRPPVRLRSVQHG